MTGKPVVFIVAYNFKNPNWLKANQLAIYKREQIQLAIRAGIEVRASGLQFQRSNGSAILPPVEEHKKCLPSYKITFIRKCSEKRRLKLRMLLFLLISEPDST